MFSENIVDFFYVRGIQRLIAMEKRDGNKTFGATTGSYQRNTLVHRKKIN